MRSCSYQYAKCHLNAQIVGKNRGSLKKRLKFYIVFLLIIPKQGRVNTDETKNETVTTNLTLMSFSITNISSMEQDEGPIKGRSASQACAEQELQRSKKRARTEQIRGRAENSEAESVESKEEKEAASSADRGIIPAEAEDTKSFIAKYVADVETETALSSHRRELEEFLGAINKLSPFMATMLYKPLAEMKKYLDLTAEIYQSRQFNPFSLEATTAGGHHIPVEVLVKIAGMLDSKDLCSLSRVSPFAYGIALEANLYYREARKNTPFNSVIELQKALREEHPEALAAIGITRHKALQRRAIIELEILIQNFIKDCLQKDTFCGISIDNYKQSQNCPKWFDIVKSYNRRQGEASI
ncbi:F-box protein [Candidatus Odyssella thessalonicensis]|uniref:F-box protein n=1 Tax=Candidatus Odyssella thessalonicensis TaxID=84647 RepID=UPI001112724E|nr:F-box protein [Candidatus Odyssella thessalonicensis]